MIRAVEANKLTDTYFDDGFKASEKWLADHMKKAEVEINAAARKGETSARYSWAFANDELAKARTNLLSSSIEKFGYIVSVSTENRHSGQGAVLKETYTNFDIDWSKKDQGAE